jgi:hypothetical protein
MKRNILALVSRRWQQGIAAVVLFSVPVLAIAWLCPGLLLAGSAGPATQDLTFDAPAATFANALATEAKAGLTHKDDAVFLAEHWAYTSAQTEAAEDNIAPAPPGEDESLETHQGTGTVTVTTKSDFNSFQTQDRKNFNLDDKAERKAFTAFQHSFIGSKTERQARRAIFEAREDAERNAFRNIQKVQRAQFSTGTTSFSHAY